MTDAFRYPIMNEAGTLVVSYGQLWNRVTDYLTLLHWAMEPRDMTEDAGVVVGANGPTAAMWTPRAGLRELPCLLDQLGLSYAGWTLTRADTISDDGTVIFGRGIDPDGKPAAWRLFLPFLPSSADLDDGSGLGHPDGGLDINDLLYFLGGFEAGSTAADLDNGGGQGERDGAVDINDLLFFLAHFEAGC